MYPKTRIPLPPQYQAIYQEHIQANRSGQGLAHKLTLILEQWMHRIVAQRANPSDSILEIGSGNLNHIKFEEFAYYDVIEPNPALFLADESRARRIRQRFSGLDEIKESSYQRIFSIAVLEHVDDLPALIDGVRPLLLPGGVFQVAIPTEGGLLWAAASKLKGFFFKRRYGLDYGVLMAYEHINTEAEIVGLVRERFDRVKVRRFPTPFKHLSLYTYLEAF